MSIRARPGVAHHRFAALLVLLLTGCAARNATSSDASGSVYRQGAVAADHAIASQAGLEMLRRGGNAVDAAVATSFCLSVVRPFSCGIGGGGFMLIWIPDERGGDGNERGRCVALDYRETCPAGVGPDFYETLGDSSASRYGWRASGVPGTVAGLCFALKSFGRLDLKTVLGPAIRAADDGFVADAAFVGAANEVSKTLATRPDLVAALGPIWSDLCRGGSVKVGDVIRNPDQAKALRLIAEHGPTAFYQGAIAQAIVAGMQAHGGTLTLADLSGYRVREMQPLRGEFRGHEVLSMPPPSSGGIAMQQVFGILQRREADLDAATHNSAEYVHLTTEAMKHAFADRSRWLADPDFAEVPVDALLDEAYLQSRAHSIDLKTTQPSASYGVQALPDDGGTSHLSVVDSRGMAVACTETINLEFGSLVCVPGFGFCLNNEMDDFTTRPGQANAFGLRQSDSNLPMPGKRPLSSMSPTIVLRDGRAMIIAGASGGPRIISATTQCLLNEILFGMPPEQAVSVPRFHHQWMPDTLLFDDRWTNREVMVELQQRGHVTGRLTREAAVQMIVIDNDGTIRAASDPRKGGRPAGH